MKLLVTDLDNTLYDWVTFFSASFDALVTALELRIRVPRQQLLSEFKAVHQQYHNSEHPFAACEIPSVQRYFPGQSVSSIAQELSPDVFHAFNSARKRMLKLYPGVSETLSTLRAANVRIVGHTEAIVQNALFRLDMLGILGLVDRLYAVDAALDTHPLGQRAAYEISDDFVQLVPREERKPNPELLIDICRREGVPPSRAVYVGDSIARDIAMANVAGVRSVWAKYGTNYDPKAWNLLVQVTHWTPEDVAREALLKEAARDAHPNHTIERFADLLTIINQ